MNYKRFKVTQSDGYSDTPLFEAETTEECKDFLLKQEETLELVVEDDLDDIWVPATDFLEAFERGETPEDLQFF